MDVIDQVLSVLLVLVLLGATLWWLTKKSPARFGLRTRRQRDETRLEAIERLPLTAQHALHLVRVADRAVLVAVHSGGCTMLESRPWEELSESRSGAAMSIPGGSR